jgi:molybdenum-dependent DNA-binding transcriptional regulator ModE
MPHLTVAQRYALIYKANDLGSVRAAAKALGVSPKAAYRWVHRHKDTGKAENMPRVGRKRVMNKAAAIEASRLFIEEKGHAGSIAQQLFNQGLTTTRVSKPTVIKAAREIAPMVAVRNKPRQRLSQLTRRKRLDFANKNKARNWKTVMFSDSKKFELKYPGVKISRVEWVRNGAEREAAAVNHAQVVHVYAGISRYGVTSCHIVSGTSNFKSGYMTRSGKAASGVTAEEYAVVLKNTLLLDGTRIFRNQGVLGWVFQQDNCPAHVDALSVVNEWNAKHDTSITLLSPWPPSSPDLSVIENMWSYVDAKVQAKGCKNLKEFEEAVVSEIQNVPQWYIKRLFNSLRQRMQQVIEKEGNRIAY